MTLIVVFISLTYFTARFTIMKEYGDTVHIETNEMLVYTQDEPLTQKESNLNFNIGLYTINDLA